MKYGDEMDSGAMIYIQNLIKIGSEIQKLMGEGGHRDSALSIFIFSKC
jgi:hypothetical protein